MPIPARRASLKLTGLKATLRCSQLFAGLPEVKDFQFECSEENEIGPGQWVEVRRDWVKA